MTFFGSAKYSDTVERTPDALAKLERLRTHGGLENLYGPQRFGLASAAVQGKHQVPPEPLPERMRRY